MSVQINLGQGGGLCPNDLCPESLLDVTKRIGQSHGLGPMGAEKWNQSLVERFQRGAVGQMYPQPEMHDTWPAEPEASKPDPGNLTGRVLDFRPVNQDGAIVAGKGKGHGNQHALYSTYKSRMRSEIIAALNEGEEYIIWTNRIPQFCDFQHLYWEVRSPQPGLEIEVVTHRLGADGMNFEVDQVLHLIDGSVKDSGFVDIEGAENRWSGIYHRKVGLRITTIDAPTEPDPDAEKDCAEAVKPFVLDNFSVDIGPYYICTAHGR